MNSSVMVVTGGNGILGSKVTELLLSRGHTVCSLDLEDNKNAKIGRLRNFICDVSNQRQVDTVVAQIEEEIGPIHGLHNNAATKTDDLEQFFAPIETFSLDTWNSVMGTNLAGMFLVARAVGQRMIDRGYGSIVQTSSIYGANLGPDPRIYQGAEYLGTEISTPAVYTASKAGVHGLTNHLATLWGAKGIRVNTVSPGGILSGQNSEFVEQYSKRVPLGRMAEPREVADVICFLLSNESSYVTGQNIFVDGGLSSW